MNPQNSLLSSVDDICRQYDIPTVSDHKLDPMLVKRQVKLLRDEKEIWISNVTSTPTILYPVLS